MPPAPPPSFTPTLSPRTIREVAYRVLERHRLTGGWVQDDLAAEFARGAWSPADRRLATELVCGVVRRRETLTWLLKPAISRPWEKIEPELVTLLWLGAYQLVYLDRIPSFAAIHETVELARALGQVRWTGFANGILRSLARALGDAKTDEPGPAAIPLGERQFRPIAAEVFPDPRTDLAGYLAAAYSLPAWLVAGWSREYSPDDLWTIAEGTHASPAIYIRVNPLRGTREELTALWDAAGIPWESTPLPAGLRLVDAGPIEAVPGYADGRFSPQDLTAMQAAPKLQPRPGERIWDVCAAPGTKTCHLAELSGDQAIVTATDVHVARLDQVQRGAARLGLKSVCTVPIREDLVDLPRGPFDGILVDAPCSNTGVLQRRPEARWRLTPGDIAELAELQRRILTAAVSRLAPGGRLMYATCSIERAENQRVVAAVRAEFPQLTLVEERTYLPGAGGDGGYQAVLRAGR